jgi:SAM-dependent methyltransferase
MVSRLVEAGYDVAFLKRFETLNTAAYECPVCGATDRERLCALFLDQVTRRNRSGARIRLLEVGPGPALQRYILRSGRFDYTSADLNERSADHQVDVQDLGRYPDAAFDGVLCSHVLEHVPDDRMAMRELCRVISPEGWAVVMVPIALWLDATYEDASLQDPTERARAFGQRDHVRQYAKRDFLARLHFAGFRQIQQLGARFFGQDVFARHGIASVSVLYVATPTAGRSGGVLRNADDHSVSR